MPDGPNVVVDTLPGEELTADLVTPTGHALADVEDEYVLAGWSATRANPVPKTYEVALKLLRKE
ncbi:hypothetical protein ACFQMM_03625 [Saliphagus sp. GCM10025308]